jgi:hypothetical protein
VFSWISTIDDGESSYQHTPLNADGGYIIHAGAAQHR